jgi:uncharacterized protein (TIGR01732 family)
MKMFNTTLYNFKPEGISRANDWLMVIHILGIQTKGGGFMTHVGGFGMGGGFALIVVLFILLIIIGASYGGGHVY